MRAETGSLGTGSCTINSFAILWPPPRLSYWAVSCMVSLRGRRGSSPAIACSGAILWWPHGNGKWPPWHWATLPFAMQSQRTSPIRWAIPADSFCWSSRAAESCGGSNTGSMVKRRSWRRADRPAGTAPGPQKQRNLGLACRCRVQWDDRFLVEPVVHSARKALALKVFVQQHDISILMQMLRKILCNCPLISCYLTDL